MNIKEQLEQWIEQRADNYSETMSSYEHQPSAMRGYLKGANEMKELLLIACDALTDAHKNACGCCSSDDLVEEHCHNALNKIQKKIKGE